MKLKLKYIAVLFLFVSCGLYAQLQDYSYKRSLESPTDVWHRVELPNAVFGKVSKTMSDIRVYGITKANDTLEAPYILNIAKDKSKTKTIPFTIINNTKTNDGYYYTFQLDETAIINQIMPSFKTLNFDWNVTLEGSHNQTEWFTILEDYRILSIKNKHTDYQFSKLNFQKAKYKFFRLFVPSIVNPKLGSVHIKMQKNNLGDFNTYAIKNLEIKEDKVNKTTVIDLELENAVPINYLKLNVLEDHEYYRALDVTYLANSIKTEKGWKHEYNSLYHSTLSSLDDTVFKFKGAIAKKLRIKIYNADNAPLAINTIKVKGYKYSLVARFDKPADYVLAYGNPEVYKPNYDIVRFTKNIPENLTALTMGEELQIPKTEKATIAPLFENKYWLWFLMLVIIIILGGFTLKIMQKP